MSKGQVWDAGRYEKNARFVSDLGMPVVELLAPKPGERILDLGCGDGVLTLKLLDVAGEVVGVDASPEFVKAAKARGVDARLMDGHKLKFKNEFDAVFSNAALHWMKKAPEKVIEGVKKALKPGGRFVAEMGGKGNVQSIVIALETALLERGIDPAPLHPWYFPSDTEYRTLLEKHGFTVDTIQLFPRLTTAAGDVKGWLETMALSFMAPIPEKDREAFLDDVRRRLMLGLYNPSTGEWALDYVRLRFSAHI